MTTPHPERERQVPPDFEQCQTERPSTWPDMPLFLTLGPVSYTRCTERPMWVAADGAGSMTLCDECKGVMASLMPEVKLRRLAEPESGEVEE